MWKKHGRYALETVRTHARTDGQGKHYIPPTLLKRGYNNKNYSYISSSSQPALSAMNKWFTKFHAVKQSAQLTSAIFLFSQHIFQSPWNKLTMYIHIIERYSLNSSDLSHWGHPWCLYVLWGAPYGGLPWADVRKNPENYIINPGTKFLSPTKHLRQSIIKYLFDVDEPPDGNIPPTKCMIPYSARLP